MNNISRRQFLAATATAAGTAVLGNSGRVSANSKLNIAGIGIGGMGRSNLRALAEGGENIVALCDLDHEYAAGTFRSRPKPIDTSGRPIGTSGRYSGGSTSIRPDFVDYFPQKMRSLPL